LQTPVSFEVEIGFLKAISVEQLTFWIQASNSRMNNGKNLKKN
jgi:hypothetical protein